jgi:cell division protein FtsW
MLIALFVFLFIRGISIAGRSNDRFLSYLAYGLTLMVSLQALINFAVVTGLVPTKGLPLPFVSYGGSALLMNMAAVGMLLRISKGDEAAASPTDRNRKTRIMARRNIYSRKGYRI